MIVDGGNIINDGRIVKIHCKKLHQNKIHTRGNTESEIYPVVAKLQWSLESKHCDDFLYPAPASVSQH